MVEIVVRSELGLASITLTEDVAGDADAAIDRHMQSVMRARAKIEMAMVLSDLAAVRKSLREMPDRHEAELKKIAVDKARLLVQYNATNEQRGRRTVELLPAQRRELEKFDAMLAAARERHDKEKADLQAREVEFEAKRERQKQIIDGKERWETLVAEALGNDELPQAAE